MSFWSDISRFAGNITGGFIGESDEERRQKERARQQAAANAAANTRPTQQQGPERQAGNTQTLQVGDVNRGRPQTALTVEKKKPVGFDNKAVRVQPRYTFKQRPDRGFDFFDGDKKVDKQTYVKGTGEDEIELGTRLAKQGDVQSAREVAAQAPQMFNMGRNSNINEAKKLLKKHEDAQKFQEEQERKNTVGKIYDSNLKLQSKGIGVKEAVDGYSQADAWKQQQIRDELEKEATYRGAFDEKREARKKEAAILLAALDEKGDSKFNLAQKALNLGGDIVEGTIDMVFNLKDATRQMTALGADGKTARNDLDEAYKNGQISREEYLDRTSEEANRLETFAGSQDKGLLDRALRSAAIATDAATTLVPISSGFRGAKVGMELADQGTKAASKGVLDRAIREAALNSALSVPGAFSQGVDTTVGDVAASAGIGAVMGGVPSVAASGATIGFKQIRDRLANNAAEVAEKQLGRPLTAVERAEIDADVDVEVQAKADAGEIPANNPSDFEAAAPAPNPNSIASEMATPEVAPNLTPVIPDEVTPGIDNRTLPSNNLGLDNLDARERFAQGRELDSQNPETQKALVDQEINARISQLPDDNYVQQMMERFGVSDATIRRLMQQTSKSDIFRKLNDAADFVRTANSPDAAAQSIINKATDAGRAAAARAGVEVPEFVKSEPIPEAQGQGPLAAPDALNSPTPETAQTPIAETRADEAANGDGLQEIATNADLSARAKNSLENDVTGQKPGGVERSGQFVENGGARPVEYRRLEDGSIAIVDGRHTLEYARQNNITNFPMKDVTEQYAPKIDAVSIAERTTALPDSRKATGDDIPAIKDTQNATVQQLDNFETNTTPDARAKMMQEVAEHERSGAELSPESKALYDEFVRPVVDALYGKSRRAGTMGQKQYYLPEEVAGSDAPVQAKFGSTWADEANMEFGHSMRREGKIDTTDLADPATSLKNYVQQFYHDNYGHLSPENIAEAEARGAVDGAAYVTGRRNVAEKLDESMVRSLSDKKKGKSTKVRVKDTLHIAEDIRKNADETLDPESILQLKGGVDISRAVRTNRKVANKIEAGNGLTAYERFGMRQFENAEALGNDAFEQNFQPGVSRQEYTNNLHGYYDGIYERDFKDVMSPQRFQEIVDSGISQSHRVESGSPLARVEQALAMEKAIYASEHIRYSDKATQKYIDYEVGHMLRRGKMPSTLARTVANNISRTFYSGALGLNPLSAIQNFTELSRVAGLTATKDTAKTLEAQVKGATPKQVKETLQSYGIDSNRIRQEMTDALPTNKKVLKFAGKARDKVEDTVMAGFNFTETLKNYGMIKALEIKHQDIADPRLRREAIMDDFNANSLIGGHYGNLVGVDRSNLARVAMQFGTYTMRDWGQIADRAKAGDAAYVARVLGTKAALALPMYALFGTSLAYTLGINEFKGGPIVSLGTELINSVVDENNRVESEQEEGKKAEFDWENVTSQFSKKATPLVIPGGNYMFNKLGVQDAVGADKENKVFREDTFIGDQQKGFNSNKNGQPRFAAAEDPMSVIRGVIGGAYNTDEARDYFGKDFWAKPQLFGLFDTNTQKNSPAYGRFQDKIEAQSGVLTDPAASQEAKAKARATIRDTFDKAYQSQDLKNDFFTKNPNAAGIYKDMTKAVFNKETGKRETDVISPEKWKYVEAEKSGELFKFLKDRAEQNHKNFGDPIDPIYSADITEAQRREVLNLRSSFTGDDKERKSMLYEQEWYNDFAGKMSEYYAEMGKQTFAEDSDFGKTKRAQEYMDLSGKMPQRGDLYKQYQAIRYGDSKTGKAGDEAAGKAFYKANADALSAVNEQYKKESFEWTNKMRVLEGATPLTWESFNNDTYGYKSGGSGASGGRKGYGKGGGGSKEKKASTRTGVEDLLTNYGSKSSGPVKLKLKQNELVDVTKVVKQPKRATKKANFRITI